MHARCFDGVSPGTAQGGGYQLGHGVGFTGGGLAGGVFHDDRLKGAGCQVLPDDANHAGIGDVAVFGDERDAEHEGFRHDQAVKWI